MAPWLPVLVSLIILLFPIAEEARGSDDPRRVLVVYNADFPDWNGNGIGDSLEVALYFKSRRRIPDGNMLGVHCSLDFKYEYEDWGDLFHEIIEPLRTRLSLLGEEEIDMIVTCHGMPVKFIRKYSPFTDRAIDQIIGYPWNIGTAQNYHLPKRSWPNPYHESSPTIPPDKGHFDHSYKYNGFNIYLVTRLDGPSANHAIDLVERALYGEKYLWPAAGYFSGTLYIDTQYKAYTNQELQGYPFHYTTYTSCDKSIAYSKIFAEASDYDWLWENTSTEVEIGDSGAMYHTGAPADHAADALFYAGWYNINKYNDVWEWIPGSAACDFNSLSILGIRDETPPSFLASAFLRGLTCGTGVIFEPETVGHQKPEVFFHAMLNGFNFAEACGLATPTLCFSNMSVGDPLYNPHRAGKIPAIDSTPPPLPRVTILAEPGVDTERTLSLAIDTRRREPDVVVAAVKYGPTAGYGSSVPSETVFRVRHAVSITGLTPSTFYHFLARVDDPAGLTAETADAIFFTEQPAPLIVGAEPETQSVGANTPFALDLYMVSQGGIEKITQCGVSLTAPHLDVFDHDATPYFRALPRVLETDPDLTTYLYHFTLPGFSVPGTYLFEVAAIHDGTVLAEDSCSVIVY